MFLPSGERIRKPALIDPHRTGVQKLGTHLHTRGQQYVGFPQCVLFGTQKDWRSYVILSANLSSFRIYWQKLQKGNA